MASCLLLVATVSCQTTPKPATQPPAATLNAQGIAEKEPEKARQFFQKAITVDPFYGPAHTNLGIIYLKEGNYYQAAKAFDQAIKLMPNASQPRLYLGLVYEEVGELSNALEQLTHALKLAPDSMEHLQALTRVRVKLYQIDTYTLTCLRRIASQGTDESWRTWAKSLIIKYNFLEDTSSSDTPETSNHGNVEESGVWGRLGR